MRTDLADLRGLCVDLGMMASSPLDFAASFAALSASSLPSMSLCPGIHLISTCMLLSSMSDSILWIAEMRTPCPDCLLGLLRPLIAAWLSAYITHFVNEGGLFRAMSVANSNAVASAVYTLCSSSDPRYWCRVCDIFGQTAAAPTCPSIPKPSV